MPNFETPTNAPIAVGVGVGVVASRVIGTFGHGHCHKRVSAHHSGFRFKDYNGFGLSGGVEISQCW
jgi:hypothetical protein